VDRPGLHVGFTSSCRRSCCILTRVSSLLRGCLSLLPGARHEATTRSSHGVASTPLPLNNNAASIRGDQGNRLPLLRIGLRARAAGETRGHQITRPGVQRTRRCTALEAASTAHLILVSWSALALSWKSPPAVEGRAAARRACETSGLLTARLSVREAGARARSWVVGVVGPPTATARGGAQAPVGTHQAPTNPSQPETPPVAP
jgi:hypothetical protein